jgi:hypothetical protein
LNLAHIALINMSKTESYHRDDGPPALEDADVDDDDVPSNAYFVSGSSGNVSIATNASESDEESSKNFLETPFAVPLKQDIETRTPKMIERTSRASKEKASEREAGSSRGDGHRRRPPARTKSGDGMKGSYGVRRRPPPRTKSREGFIETEDFVRKLNINDSDNDGGECPKDKGEILKRNAARRQKSSEMLVAMRDATRQAPDRSKSIGATLQHRRPPARTKSGTVADDGDAVRPGPRRRPPARTKSGDGLKGEGPARRRPPARTKSGDVPKNIASVS